VAFLDAHLELEGGRVSLLRDVDGFLAHIFVLLAIIALHAIA
jgi:hypothetical protein